MKKWSIFLTIFSFSLFFCTLKYANMIRISNMSFFRFCWKNEKIDWPNCARTVRGCHTERVFHCGLFPLSLTMYFTNLFSCTTLSIGYLSYEGATVLARIAMLFNLCFQCQFACGSWLGQPGAAGNDRTLQDFLISSLFSVKIFLGVLSSGSWWGGHTLCALLALISSAPFPKRHSIT